MKKPTATVLLATAISLSNLTLADELEDYNEANCYSGKDALNLAEAIHDQRTSRQTVMARQRQVLENYNEANGYSGADVLTLEEMVHDQIIGGHVQYDAHQQMFTLRDTLNRVRTAAEAN